MLIPPWICLSIHTYMTLQLDDSNDRTDGVHHYTRRQCRACHETQAMHLSHIASPTLTTNAPTKNIRVWIPESRPMNLGIQPFKLRIWVKAWTSWLWVCGLAAFVLLLLLCTTINYYYCCYYYYTCHYYYEYFYHHRLMLPKGLYAEFAVDPRVCASDASVFFWGVSFPGTEGSPQNDRSGDLFIVVAWDSSEGRNMQLTGVQGNPWADTTQLCIVC